MPRPTISEYAPFYQPYIEKVHYEDVHEALGHYSRSTLAFWQSIAEDKGDFAYAPGKWTIKQVLKHISDTERIFAYRALCIARGDKTPLPGFDENLYANAAGVDHCTLKELVHEFQSVRGATLSLFNSFGNNELVQVGAANDAPVTPNAIGYMIIGHAMHHEGVVMERYKP